MSNLSNPGTARTAFATYAEAQAASVLASVNRIFVGPLCYERDASGTALTTRGGQNWSPAAGGPCTLAHWGVLGVPHGAAAVPQGFRYMAAPPVAETARIQAAFDWCVSRGLHLQGDPARVYGITAQVVFGARPLTGGGFTSVRDGARISDVNLRVIGGTWAAGSRAGLDDDAWTYGDAALVIGKSVGAGGAGKPLVNSERCRVDAARIAPVAIQITGTGLGARHIGHRCERGTEAEMVAGFPGNSTGSGAIDSFTNTDAVFIAISGASYLFEERSDGTFGPNDGTGWWGLSGRTSHGLVVRGSDMRFESCVFQTGLLCLMLGRGFDNQFNGCKFWSGATETDPNSRVTHIGARAGGLTAGYRFTGCTFQDGQVYIKGMKGAWTGNAFGKFTFNQIRLVSTSPDETATGMVFVGNSCHDDNVLFVTEGSGTWGEFQGEAAANNREDGTALQFQGQTLINGYFRVTVDGFIRAGLITPPVSSAAPGQTGDRGIGTDGRMYAYVGGQWLRSDVMATF
jgi:hypothetical protein